jgi:hypothetical protein
MIRKAHDRKKADNGEAKRHGHKQDAGETRCEREKTVNGRRERGR